MNYYRPDIRNFRFAELWRIQRLAFPALALFKIFRIPFPVRIALPFPPRVVAVDRSELDRDGRGARLRKEFQALESQAVEFQFLYRVPSICPDSDALGAAFLRRDGWVVGTLLESVERVGSHTQRRKIFSLTTQLSNDRLLITTSCRLLDDPPSFEVEVFRGKRSRLIQRHLSRVGEALYSPRSIRSEELLTFLGSLETRSQEFHIERRAYVPMTPEAVEKLTRQKPRGTASTLKMKALGWSVGIAVGVFSAFGGFQSCGVGEWEPEDATAIFSSDQRETYLCNEARGLGTLAAQPASHVATLVARFGSLELASSAEEMAATLVTIEEGQYQLTRLGSSLLFRLSEGNLPSIKAIHDSWIESADSVFVIAQQEGANWAMTFSATWDIEGSKAEELVSSAEDYLAPGPSWNLIPPWSEEELSTTITPAQANARRSYRRLQEADFQAMTDESFGFFTVIGSIWKMATRDGDDWREEMSAQQAERVSVLEDLAEELFTNDSTLDRRVFDLYIESQTEVWSGIGVEVDSADLFEMAEETQEDQQIDQSELTQQWGDSQVSRELRNRLGSMLVDERDPERKDPRSRFAAESGWTLRSEDEFGLQTFLTDPLPASQAILGFACLSGVSKVTFELETAGY